MIFKKEHSDDHDQIEFVNQEESKQMRESINQSKKSISKKSNKYMSKEIGSMIDESSVIKSKNKNKPIHSKLNHSQLRIDGLEKLNCSQSMVSILNFNPKDIIANKLHTYRTRKSGVSSNTILKTPGGYEAIGSRPLKYLQNDFKRLKNKRQFSENQQLRISSEMQGIVHKHHLSSGDKKLLQLNESQLRMLENAKEGDLLREMSNFMDPREIISIFSMERRDSPNYPREKVLNSVQLSTLSTNPKKRERSHKHHYDDESDQIPHFDNLNAEERNALIEEHSGLYDDVMLEDESQGVGPNEAMYINIQPIPTTLMLTFEEAIQRQKEILDKSSKVNK